MAEQLQHLSSKEQQLTQTLTRTGVQRGQDWLEQNKDRQRFS